MRPASDDDVPITASKSDHPLQQENAEDHPLHADDPVRERGLQVADDPAHAPSDVVKPVDFEDPEPQDEDDDTMEMANTTGKEADPNPVPDPGEKAVSHDAGMSTDGAHGDAEDSSSKGAKLQLTPEQIEKAKGARQAALNAEEQKTEKKRERIRSFLANAENVSVQLGERTGAFRLGEKARASAQLVVQDAIALGQKENPSRQEKLKASAATAAKALVDTVVKGWEEKLVPQVRTQFPEEYSRVTNRALASMALGLFVAIALLPSLFGGGKPQESPVKKKIEADTAALEKKLSKERALSSYGSRSAPQKDLFPPDDQVVPPKSKSSAPRTIETPLKSEKTPVPSGKGPESRKSSTDSAEAPKPPAVTPPSASVVPPRSAPVAPPAAEVSPNTQPEKEILKPVDVTPSMALTAVSRALGSNANLVSSASFDSLEEEPTLVLQVSRAFHQLPAAQQKTVADKALKASRTLGYERVSFIESDTGMEVAHAGIDIDLEDEVENLRADLNAIKKQADRLSTQNTKDEAEIDALKNRMVQERDEYGAAKIVFERRLLNLQNENAGLIEDLEEAKQELSKIPDRVALEERTVEAERRSEKLSDTVEMLSKQLTKAREEEARAKQAEANSLQATRDSEKARDDALASVTERIGKAQDEANRKATANILSTQNEAKAATDLANKRVKDAEETLASSQRESGRALEETKTSYERQLAVARENKDKEVTSIQDKYEAMLKDVQRRAQADLDAFQREADKRMEQAVKEARATANALTKERDQAMKATEKAQAVGEKAAAKAAKEKENLQSQIAKLEAKLKSGADKVVNEGVMGNLKEGIGADK